MLAIASVATLAGSGVVAKSTTISGQHKPGQFGAVGQQTFSGGVSYTNTSTFDWQLAANSETGPGTNFDQVLLTSGNLTISPGAGIQLSFNGPGSLVDWNSAFWNQDRQWLAVNNLGTGSVTGVYSVIGISNDALGNSFAAARPGSSFTVSNMGAGIFLNYTAVPEPSGVLVVVAVSGMCLFHRLRRRRKTGRSALPLSRLETGPPAHRRGACIA